MPLIEGQILTPSLSEHRAAVEASSRSTLLRPPSLLPSSDEAVRPGTAFYVTVANTIRKRRRFTHSMVEHTTFFVVRVARSMIRARPRCAGRGDPRSFKLELEQDGRVLPRRRRCRQADDASKWGCSTTKSILQTSARSRSICVCCIQVYLCR